MKNELYFPGLLPRIRRLVRELLGVDSMPYRKRQKGLVFCSKCAKLLRRDLADENVSTKDGRTCYHYKCMACVVSHLDNMEYGKSRFSRYTNIGVLGRAMENYAAPTTAEKLEWFENPELNL